MGVRAPAWLPPSRGLRSDSGNRNQLESHKIIADRRERGLEELSGTSYTLLGVVRKGFIQAVAFEVGYHLSSTSQVHLLLSH